jgi:hypothetical protein
MSVFSRPSNGNGESKNGGEDSGAWKLVPPAAGASGTDADDDEVVTLDPDEPAAQPTAQLTGDGTLPIEIVDPAEAPALIIDERGLPEKVSGEIPRAAGAASPTPPAGAAAPSVQAPPPCPCPPARPGRGCARGRPVTAPAVRWPARRRRCTGSR